MLILPSVSVGREYEVRLRDFETGSDATLKINGRSYKIEKLLGEGGFAFVYLIRDESSGRAYALKKILVTSGEEGVKEAMREVEAYRRFRHPNIIQVLDSAVVQDEGGKIIYLWVSRNNRAESADSYLTTLEVTCKTP